MYQLYKNGYYKTKGEQFVDYDDNGNPITSQTTDNERLIQVGLADRPY